MNGLLILQIERLRFKLIHMSTRRGFNDGKVVALSQELDRLLNLYNRGYQGEKNVALGGYLQAHSPANR